MSTKQLNVFQGEWSSKEAKENLISFLDYNIQYHKLQKFIQSEVNHNQHSDEFRNIIQLEEIKQNIAQQIEELNHTNKQIRIESELLITISSF